MFFGSPVGNGFIEGGYASPVILHTGGFEKLASATATTLTRRKAKEGK